MKEYNSIKNYPNNGFKSLTYKFRDILKLIISVLTVYHNMHQTAYESLKGMGVAVSASTL